MPKFSIVIPVFRTEKYLNACVKSVLSQSFTDFELILIDDGSPDRCPALCDEWAEKDKRIRVIHKKNGGVSSARNRGVREAVGEYIAFVDSDDEVQSDWLINVSQALVDKKVDIVSFGIIDVTAEKETSTHTLPFFYSPNKAAFSMYVGEYYKKLFGSVCVKIYRAALVQDNNILFDEQLAINEDAFFDYDTVSKANSFLNLGEAFYRYNHYATSSSARGRTDVLKVFLRRAERHGRFLRENGWTDVGLPSERDIIQTGVFSQFLQATISTTQFNLQQRIAILKELYTNNVYRDMLLQSVQEQPASIPSLLGVISVACRIPQIIALPVAVKKRLLIQRG